MNIAIFGDGLKSKVAAALFASVGNQVYVFNAVGLDSGFINEPQLEKIYHQQKLTKRLSEFNVEGKNNVLFDYLVVADVKLSSVLECFSDTITDSIKNQCTIINLTPAEIGESESTYLEYINSLKISEEDKKQIYPVCCIPLLIREGRAVVDFSRPDNIIVGCDNSEQVNGLKALFYPFNRAKDVIKVVTTKEAEFSCFAGNAMLATRLSFMNEMADLADRSNVDIEIVRECIGSDPRIGNDYLYPSCGYGGKALAGNLSKVAEALKTRTGDLGLLNVVAEINERQKEVLFRKLWKFFNTRLKGKKIAIWGASFKPGSPSIASAPSVKLIDSLLAQGASVNVYDPLALNNLKLKYGSNAAVLFIDDRDLALEGCDALAICTEWKEFWSPNFSLVKEKLKSSAIFDGRNLYRPEQLKHFGIKYFGIGRGERI